MRVIAGSARSIALKTVMGTNTRPTTDRIKETLFNIMQNVIPDSRFLDLFSGSGAIGIEALSRGAAYTVFVEKSRTAAECIRENLLRTGLSRHGRIEACEAVQALRRMDGIEKPFDVVFMDPPYNKEQERKTLSVLADTSLIHEETLIVAEASLETDFTWLESAGYRVIKRKEYKTNQHLFLEYLGGETT